METFKTIRGFDGEYVVSDAGAVKSLARFDRQGCWRKERVLKLSRTEDGYLKANLWRGPGGRIQVLVHHLVLEAFVSPRPEGHEGNHKNGKRDDNRPDNLEWLTHAENVRYSKDVLKANYVTRGNARMTEAQVLEIRALAEQRIRHAAIAEQYGISIQLVSAINTRAVWAHL